MILANPENRRVTLFQEALLKAGQPPADVVSWADVLEDPRRLARFANEPRLFRIDSAGEDQAVEYGLLRAGYAAAVDFGCATIAPDQLATLAPSRGRILCPRQAHLGFERTLRTVAEVLADHPRWRVLNPVDDILECFDKRVTSKRFEALGVPVPPALREVTTLEGLRAGMATRGWRSVFVKISCGSSASCLGVLTRTRAETFFTTIEQAADGWFNNLNMRQVRDPARIDELVGFLLREGAQVECAVPKARLERAYFDCRVLCIAHEPRFVVVRQNHHVVTNLHLGGWRGQLELLQARVPPEAWAAAMQSCRAVAKCYGALHVGIDLMFEPDFTKHRVIEVNAFGDLLPNLVVNGQTVYDAEIEAALKWSAD